MELVRRGMGEGADLDRVRSRICELTLDPANLSWVVERGGRITAYLLGVVSRQLWRDAPQVTVVGWYSESPGDGLALMSRAVKHARKSGMLMVVMTNSADPRLEAALHQRYGAKARGCYTIAG